MDKPISVGDLVRITHACCDPASVIGYIENVTRIFNTITTCGKCGQAHRGMHAKFEGNPDHWGFPLAWLKRIPPLDDLEGLESEEVDKLPSQRMIEAAKRYKRLVTSK